MRIPIARRAGITTVLSRPKGYIISGTGVAFDLTGDVASLKSARRSAAMFASVKQAFLPSSKTPQSRSRVWLQLREIIEDVRLFTSRQRPFERRQLRSLTLKPLHLRAMQPVLQGKIPFVIRADRLSDIQAVISLHDDLHEDNNPVRLVIEGGQESWLLAGELAKRKIAVILTPLNLVPREFDNLQTRLDAPVILADAGVDVIFTSGWHATRLRQQAGVAVANGLGLKRALSAITSTPARVFNQKGVGRLHPGMRANIVLWDGDPLDVSTTPRGLWIDGVSQDLENRHTKLARKYFRTRVTVAKEHKGKSSPAQ